MKVSIIFINQELENEEESVNTDKVSTTCYSRLKSYESDTMDDDMKISTVSHMVDRIFLDRVQLTSKSSIDDLIEFLENSKPSFKH